MSYSNKSIMVFEYINDCEKKGRSKKELRFYVNVNATHITHKE